MESDRFSMHPVPRGSASGQGDGLAKGRLASDGLSTEHQSCSWTRLRQMAVKFAVVQCRGWTY